MASKTEICNLALTHIGVGKEISNLETERSPEATACRRIYETCLRTTLRAAHWPFATKFADLALIEEDATTDFTYSYGYPSDCVDFRRIVSGVPNETAQDRVVYRIAYGESAQIILTNQENAEGEYTVFVEDPARYPADFTMALSLLIAFYIAPKLTAGDPFKLGQRAMQLYSFEISRAVSNAHNEEQSQQSPDAEVIRERG